MLRVVWIEAVAWSGLALRDEESRPVEARPRTGVPFRDVEMLALTPLFDFLDTRGWLSLFALTNNQTGDSRYC